MGYTASNKCLRQKEEAMHNEMITVTENTLLQPTYKFDQRQICRGLILKCPDKMLIFSFFTIKIILQSNLKIFPEATVMNSSSKD